MTTETDNVGTVPAPADAKEQIAAAVKTGKARGKFRSVEEVVAAGIKAGEKEPSAGTQALAEEKTEPTALLPEKIEIEVDDEGNRTVPLHEPAPPAEEVPAVPPAKEAASASKKIKIGEREFTSEDEAITYAQDLENQRILDEAFRQGVEAAQQTPFSNLNPAAPAKPAEPDKIDDTYYTNPAAYLAKRDAEILAKATQNITAQFEARQKHEQLMQKFWSDYPDLARNQATKDLTAAILNYAATGDLKSVPTEKALKIVAERARGRLTELGVTTLPTKVLPSSAKPAVSAGSPTTTSRPKQEEKHLNFTQFMRQTKIKKAEARRSR